MLENVSAIEPKEASNPVCSYTDVRRYVRGWLHHGHLELHPRVYESMTSRCTTHT